MEFTFYEKKFYVIAEKLGLKIEEIDKFKTDLLNESILFTTPQTNRANQPITFEIKFDQFREEFVFTILSTKLEVVEFNERLKLKEQYFAEEIKQRILDLNSYQSVSLINEVLGNDSLEWVENYEKGKMTRDGGIDFTAEFCINREGEISFDGFGKFFKVFGQLKHLSKKMAEPEIRDLIGTMSKDEVLLGYFS